MRHVGHELRPMAPSRRLPCSHHAEALRADRLLAACRDVYAGEAAGRRRACRRRQGASPQANLAQGAACACMRPAAGRLPREPEGTDGARVRGQVQPRGGRPKGVQGGAWRKAPRPNQPPQLAGVHRLGQRAARRACGTGGARAAQPAACGCQQRRLSLRAHGTLERGAARVEAGPLDAVQLRPEARCRHPHGSGRLKSTGLPAA